MRRVAGLVLGMAVAVVAACAGEAPSGLNIPPGNPTGGGGSDTGGSGGGAPVGSAMELYLDTVHDDFVSVCGACHSEGVVGAPVFTNDAGQVSYNLLTGFPGILGPPTSSKIVIYGAHTGPALDDVGNPPLLYDHVVAWLAKEAEERGLIDDPQQPAGPTFEEAMLAFADCMRLDVWEGVGMYMVPVQQTNGKGPCLGCHQAPNGVGGLVLDDDTLATFNATKKKHNLLKYVTGAYDDEGKFLQLIPAGRLLEKPGEPCVFPNPDACHPSYQLDTVAIDAIVGFVQHTLDALENDTCDVPYPGG
jgi:hypothetical protein